MNNRPEPTEIDISSDPVILAYKKDVDRTLIRHNLRLTVDERFEQLMKLQEFAEQLRVAGRKTEPQK